MHPRAPLGPASASTLASTSASTLSFHPHCPPSLPSLTVHPLCLLSVSTSLSTVSSLNIRSVSALFTQCPLAVSTLTILHSQCPLCILSVYSQHLPCVHSVTAHSLRSLSVSTFSIHSQRPCSTFTQCPLAASTMCVPGCGAALPSLKAQGERWATHLRAGPRAADEGHRTLCPLSNPAASNGHGSLGPTGQQESWHSKCRRTWPGAAPGE